MTKQSPSPTPADFLPEGFAPSGKDIVVGRGKKCTNHAGNRKMRAMVHAKLQEYSTANDKTHKTYIISQILHDIKSAGGSFVKKDGESRRWYRVRDPCARTNIAQSFRDALHDDYRSSKFSKQRRRWNSVHSSSSEEEESKPVEDKTNQVQEPSPVKIPEVATSAASGKANPSPFGLRQMLRTHMPQQQQLPQQPLMVPVPLPLQQVEGFSNAFGSGNGSLRDILNSALEVADDADMPTIYPDTTFSDQQTFDCLFSVSFFPTDGSSQPSGNPFEPTPIADRSYAV